MKRKILISEILNKIIKIFRDLRIFKNKNTYPIRRRSTDPKGFCKKEHGSGKHL